MKKPIIISLILMILLCSCPAHAAPEEAQQYDVEITQYTVRYFGTSENPSRIFLPYDGTLQSGECLWWTIGVTVQPEAPLERVRIFVFGARPRLLPTCDDVPESAYRPYTPISEDVSATYYIGPDGIWYENPMSAMWHAEHTGERAASISVFITEDANADVYWPRRERIEVPSTGDMPILYSIYRRFCYE